MPTSRLTQSLTQAGHRVVTITYPETPFTIPSLASSVVAPTITRHCPEVDRKRHIIAYGMSLFVLQQYVQDFQALNIGYAVLVNTIDVGLRYQKETIQNHPFFLAATEPTLDAAVDVTEVLPIPYGLIWGGPSMKARPLPSNLIGRSKHTTLAKAATDDVLLPAPGEFLLQNQDAIHQAAFFLAHGRFDKGED